MYRQLCDWAKSVGGSTARQARMGAILAARHADIYARLVTEKTGRKYTATDYMREKLGFSIRPAEGGLNQSAELETLRDKQEKTDADFDRMDEIKAAMDKDLQTAEMFYTWGKGNLEMREREAAEMPKPHGADGHALIVFGGQEMAMAMSSDVISAEAGKFHRATAKEAREAAVGWFYKKYPKGKSVKTKIGEVKVTKARIKDSLSHGFRDKKLDVIPVLIEGLEQADYVYSSQQKGDPRVTNHFLVFSVNVGGEENFVLCRVKEQNKDKKFYVHEVATREEIKKMSDSLLSEADGKSREALGGIALYTSILQEYISKVNNGENNQIEILNQTAWHGSPYDFETFDLGAIGTGEGAQVHGWGLYFAGDRKVSEGYRTRLGGTVKMPTFDEVVVDGQTLEDMLDDAIDNGGLSGFTGRHACGRLEGH